MRKYISIVMVVAVAAMAILAGCGGTTTNNNDTKEQMVYITIKGSDTMLHLNSNWAEDYMNKYPNVDVSVAGGGSGTGIAAMTNGTTDVAAASRLIKDKEVTALEGKNMKAVEHVVARDGIAVIVHPDNPISQLTMGQIADIFTGKVSNWNELGGEDAEIVTLTRDSSSGTYAFFQEHVLDKEDYRKDARKMTSNSSIVAECKQNPNSIGYVGLAYAVEAAGSVKPLEVAAEDGKSYVAPSFETVASGEYVISRTLQLYVLNDAPGYIQDFVSYVYSREGQDIVSETGYIPVK
ncbi:MAG TPA: phosphate ABC transporter substrate-binding protein [Caldisericia bacterium]|nr:phosphate ABC transporter substrate-binding protein [Caldisericia bacterium]HPI84369.1 phosphate ABC transporter substrate-binding protein [Caldisericia bacterium]HPQ93599.1 phosphate ABC transporter substrate-binding protein [Caldisericia bacterium]